MREIGIRSWRAPEFWLVVVMLLVLTALVFIVLWMPFDSSETGVRAMPTTDELLKSEDVKPDDLLEYNKNLLEYNKSIFEYNKDLLEYRKTILTVIVTAFGAWVGAGAAYFFSRENVREAADSLLEMQRLSLKERLGKVLIRDIPPSSLDKELIMKSTSTVGDIEGKLEQKLYRWFIPIVDDDGKLDTVIHEEAVYRYAIEKSKEQKGYEEHQISDVLKFIEETPKLKKLRDIHVKVKMDDSIGHANELMQSKNVFLAIIVDEEERPTHYVTTGDVRVVLLRF